VNRPIVFLQHHSATRFYCVGSRFFSLSLRGDETNLTFPLVTRQNLRMVSQELLDLLVCPLCKKPLELKNEGQSLKCTQCRRVYPIKDDIPIMLVDEATIDPA